MVNWKFVRWRSLTRWKIRNSHTLSHWDRISRCIYQRYTFRYEQLVIFFLKWGDVQFQNGRGVISGGTRSVTFRLVPFRRSFLTLFLKRRKFTWVPFLYFKSLVTLPSFNPLNRNFPEFILKVFCPTLYPISDVPHIHHREFFNYKIF